MTNIIGHGHVIPRDDGYKAKCGGPAVCGICRSEGVWQNRPLGWEYQLGHEAVTTVSYGSLSGPLQVIEGQTSNPSAQSPVDAERARCIEAIRTTLANWRCVPSQATREFAELCIREIEK